jgi:hypothetical protein
MLCSERGRLSRRTDRRRDPKNPDGSARIVFERGEKPEPALYADAGWSTYEDGRGDARVLTSMVGATVADTSTDGGVLVLSFDDGSALRCEPHLSYEAWQVVGGTPQSLVVAMPGGDLAIVDSSHVPTSEEAQEAVDLLKGITGWSVHVHEITETGGIIVGPEPKPPELPAEREDG